MNFSEWLQTEKGFTFKASHDANSRLKRIQALLSTEVLPADVVTKLESNPTFKSFSMCVKSQLRRTSKLYLEFQNAPKNN